MRSGSSYRDDLTEGYVAEVLDSLNHKCVVLTGVGFRPEETGSMVREGTRQVHLPHPKVGKSYHGTGDMFAASFTGALMQGKSLENAARIAGEFTRLAIENTAQAPAHWYGVKFETALPELIRMLED